MTQFKLMCASIALTIAVVPAAVKAEPDVAIEIATGLIAADASPLPPRKPVKRGTPVKNMSKEERADEMDKVREQMDYADALLKMLEKCHVCLLFWSTLIVWDERYGPSSNEASLRPDQTWSYSS